MRKTFITVALGLAALSLQAQPREEVRAVWLTTNSGLDWPAGETNVERQKESLKEILDQLDEANFNTIIFQAQVKGDVLWESSYQPSMRVVTGDASKNMSYDVSKFVIEECHKRNMECHAWIVPYRIGSATEANRYANNPLKHVYLTHPELCKESGGDQYLDPGMPEVRSYLLDLYKELIENYDYDGINFDYTRYPSSDGLPDDDSYAANNPDGLPRGDWRRQNINTFIEEFYDMAKSIKPDIKVGAAPIGCYTSLPGYANMTAYGVYQDACQWMKSGHHDLLIPQMYWNEKYGFSAHQDTWINNCDNRQLVVGIAPYKMTDSNDWRPATIYDQLDKIRNKEGMSGVCFFRAEHVIGTNSRVKQLYAKLQSEYFKYPAHIPTMDYNGVSTPGKPENVTQEYADGTYHITWDEPLTSDRPTRYYSVYICDGNSVDTRDFEKVAAFKVNGTSLDYASENPDLRFAVTTFDIANYESSPSLATNAGVEDMTEQASTFEYANGDLTISGPKTISRVEIYSVTGIKAMDVPVNNGSVTINCNRLGNGVYIVRTAYANGGNDLNKILR